MSFSFQRTGAAVHIQQGVTPVQFNPNLPLLPGDILRLSIEVLGAAAVIEGTLGVAADNSAFRLTISFVNPPVVDAGLNLYPGIDPLYLTDENIGDALVESIFAITPLGTQTISVLDIFY